MENLISKTLKQTNSHKPYHKLLSMNSNIYQRLLGVLVIAGLLAGCSAASKEDDKKARLEKLKQQQADLGKEIQNLQEQIAKENPDAASLLKTKDVQVMQVKAQPFEHYAQTQGRIESENNIMVSARTAGSITNVHVSEGSKVAKGQSLAQIDNTVILTSIEQMKSELALANSVFERQKNLWEQKIGTEVQFLQAKTTKESLEKRLASLEEQNEMTKIKSPITGVVDLVNVKVGENIAPGMPAFRVVNNNDLKLVASVSEAYVTKIKKGNPVVISIPELGEDIKASVTFVGRSIDPLSRTFTLEVDIPSHEDLRPNMTAVVKVIFNTEQNAIVVPINLIQDINGEKVVFVAEQNGKQLVARQKVLVVEGVYNGKAQVKGLNAGETIISAGFQGLTDGQFVKI